ncbi:family 43 glycosylhydrolase [Kutzneria sp. 744]|uniref:family 43 glycosylhydrolase n=1 Tax=Kutzneria sp. (strain 744) TaxID=345341 RepID=UPI0007C548B7|nr:family 43 glycosylhydrolase [Kutzneria sp. 744]
MPRPIRAMARTIGCLAAVVVLAACGSAEGITPPAPTEPTAVRKRPDQPPADAAEAALRTDRARQGAGTLVSGGPAAPYNYAPTALLDGGRYRIWWCSQLPDVGAPGDDVLTASADSVRGPFPDGTAVLHGSGAGFDAVHTCDPSVIRVNGVYYMYYTGAAGDGALVNSIGLAVSADGVNWQRRPDPVVPASMDKQRANTYGVGQPSVLHLDGWFYLMFTDTTGQAANTAGAGQFVLRSPDPAFGSAVQALTPNGFQDVPSTKAQRSLSVANAYSADWMWVDAMNAFAIAHEVDGKGTVISFWDKDFTTHPYQDVVLGGRWKEGPGLVRRADGHAPASPEDPCGRVPLDVVRATSDDGPGPTDLRLFGVDIANADGCKVLATADGVAMPSSDRMIVMVFGDRLVKIERRSVSAEIAVKVLDQPVPGLDSLPVVTVIRAGTPAVHAPDRSYAFVLDGKLWPVGAGAVTANSSPVSEISDADWDSRPKSGDLSAFRGN